MKMPKDWPAIAPKTTSSAIVGTYQATFDALLGPIFFFDNQQKVREAKLFDFIVSEPNQLKIVAWNESVTLLERTIHISDQTGAVVFTETSNAAESGLGEGSEKTTITMRTNAAGELVIQRNSITEGKYANKPTLVRLSFTFWNRAKRVTGPATTAPTAERPSP